MSPQLSRHTSAAPIDIGDLVAPNRASLARARSLVKLSETLETAPDKTDRYEAGIRINSRERLEGFCRLGGGKERLLQTLETACCDPYWRVRQVASSALKLMTDLGLLEPGRLIDLIEAGTFFETPRLTRFPSLDTDIRFLVEGVPLNREWTARANVRAAALWAWAESSKQFTAPLTGTHGFQKLYPRGSSDPFPVEASGSRDPFGAPGRYELPGLLRQYLTFATNNRSEYTRNRLFIEQGIAMLVLGAPESSRALSAAQINRLLEELAPRQAA